MIVIERAKLIDGPAVLAMIKQTQAEAYGIALSAEVEKNLLAGVLRLTLASDARVFVAVQYSKKHTRKVIGCGILEMQVSPLHGLIGFADSLYVLPEYRGEKVAEAIVAAGEQATLEMGGRQIYTNAASSVRNWLRRQGFQEGDTVMHKDLIAKEG